MRIGIIGAIGWLGSATGARLVARQVVSSRLDLILLRRHCDGLGRHPLHFNLNPTSCGTVA